MAKNGKSNPWTDKERAELVELVDSGKTDKSAAFKKFAESTGRKPATVMQQYYAIKVKERKKSKKAKKAAKSNSGKAATATVKAKPNGFVALQPLITLINSVEIERYEVEEHKVIIHF